MGKNRLIELSGIASVALCAQVVAVNAYDGYSNNQHRHAYDRYDPRESNQNLHDEDFDDWSDIDNRHHSGYSAQPQYRNARKQLKSSSHAKQEVLGFFKFLLKHHQAYSKGNEVNDFYAVVDRFYREQHVSEKAHRHIEKIIDEIIKIFDQKDIPLGFTLYQILPKNVKENFNAGKRIQKDALSIMHNMKRANQTLPNVRLEDIMILLVQLAEDDHVYQECDLDHHQCIVGGVNRFNHMLKNAGLPHQHLHKLNAFLQKAISYHFINFNDAIVKVFQKYFSADAARMLSQKYIAYMNKKAAELKNFQNIMEMYVVDQSLPWGHAQMQTMFSPLSKTPVAADSEMRDMRALSLQEVRGVLGTLISSTVTGASYEDQMKDYKLAFEVVTNQDTQAQYSDQQVSAFDRFVAYRDKAVRAMDQYKVPVAKFIFGLMNKRYEELYAEGKRVHTDAVEKYLALSQNDDAPTTLDPGYIVMLAVQLVDDHQEKCKNWGDCKNGTYKIIDKLIGTFSEHNQVISDLTTIRKQLDEFYKKFSPMPAVFSVLTKGLNSAQIKQLEGEIKQQKGEAIFEDLAHSDLEIWERIHSIPAKKLVYPWDRGAAKTKKEVVADAAKGDKAQAVVETTNTVVSLLKGLFS